MTGYRNLLHVAVMLAAACILFSATHAFVTPTSATAAAAVAQRTRITLNGSSRGMGMGATPSGKPKKANGKTAAAKGQGMGGGNTKHKNGKAPPFDANASLLRLEKKYDELISASNKAFHKASQSDTDTDDDVHVVSEMVVAVRAVSSSATTGTSDWVPIAQLCMQPHVEVGDPKVQAAVSLYCRELSVAAARGAKVFATVPRDKLQYAVEPVDSFYKHVYDPVMEEGSKSQKKKNALLTPEEEELARMTKHQARTVLELISSSDATINNNNNNKIVDDKAQIKQAYRRLSFQYHPDRLSPDLLPVQKEEAAFCYARVQKAYEILSSGVRHGNASWYASLGGRERTCFKVMDQLLGADQARSILEGGTTTNGGAAIVGLDDKVIQAFVARHQAAGTSSAAAVSTP